MRIRLSFDLKAVLFSLIALAIVSLISAPTQARTLDEIMSSKKIVVGIHAGLPPLGMYNEKNEMDGFDVELARKLGTMLGVEVELVKVAANDRIPFVASGKIDFTLGAMTRTVSRAKVIDFSLPIYTEALGVLTTKDKPYEKVEDLNDPNVRLVVVRGTTGARYIKANLPKAKVLQIDDQPELVTLLAQGRADASINVIEFLGLHMKKHKVEWKVLKTPVKIYYPKSGS